MGIPSTCKAAVFDGVGRPLRIADFPLTDPLPGHILVKVRLATLCGSDLHTVSGRRTEPVPLILGHEIVAEIAALGAGVRASATGDTLQPGDRVSFTIMASCGECANCIGGLPQKCGSLFKYGHTPCSNAPALSGGLAEYVYLRPGTAVYHVPAEISDTLVCPANCALATVANALEAIEVDAGESVLVQGAGALGLYAIAMLRERGAREVVVADLDPERLAAAAGFGASETVDVTGLSPEATAAKLGGDRFDSVVEVCGAASAVRPGVRTLRLGGRYVIVGLVCAGSEFTLDGNDITRKYLTIKGVHNYAPRHLLQAIQFLDETRSRFPYENLISRVVPLADISAAFAAAERPGSLRVAVKP